MDTVAQTSNRDGEFMDGLLAVGELAEDHRRAILRALSPEADAASLHQLSDRVFEYAVTSELVEKFTQILTAGHYLDMRPCQELQRVVNDHVKEMHTRVRAAINKVQGGRNA